MADRPTEAQQVAAIMAAARQAWDGAPIEPTGQRLRSKRTGRTIRIDHAIHHVADSEEWAATRADGIDLETAVGRFVDAVMAWIAEEATRGMFGIDGLFTATQLHDSVNDAKETA